MNINLFDTLYADLGVNNVGSEQGKIRMCVVVQNDDGNRCSPTIMIVPFTHGEKNLWLPTHELIKRDNKNNLKCDSTLLGEQTRVIDKSRIKSVVGNISDEVSQNKIIKVYLANLFGKKKVKVEVV